MEGGKREVERCKWKDPGDLHEVVPLGLDGLQKCLSYTSVKDSVAKSSLVDRDFFTVDLEKNDQGKESDEEELAQSWKLEVRGWKLI